MNNLALSGSLRAFNLLWIVYTVREAATARIIYIGHCRLVDVYALHDLRAMQGFDTDMNIIITVDSFHNDQNAAKRQASRLIVVNELPEFNRSKAMQRFNIIECLETGEQWMNAAETARACGISPAALANHLNGRPGYNSVKGRHYRRVARPLTVGSVVVNGVSHTRDPDDNCC